MGTKALKPQTISLLEGIRERMARGIYLMECNKDVCMYVKLEQRHINELLVNKFESCIKRYQGKPLVKISIIDHEEQIAIPTLSKQYCVQLNNELFALLSNLPIDFLLCS
jgi:hypothetical protein